MSVWAPPEMASLIISNMHRFIYITEKVIPENVFPTGNLVSVSTEEIFGCAYNLYTFSMKKFYV